MILRRLHAACFAVLLFLGLFAPAARGGGGPENVCLVVNAASWASLTVANHFIRLRQIPPANVFYINWTDGWDSTDGESLRRKILLPAVEAMAKRGIFHQIDYIVYSADLPYHVNLSADFAEAERFPAQASPSCSINSATYLWHLVMTKSPLVMKFGVNQYMRTFVKKQAKFARRPDPPTHGFHSWLGWSNTGEMMEAGGQPYMLSTMLAMTSGRGNSVAQAVEYLRRSAAADGTFPKGTIYFTKTDDIRTTARADEVPGVIAELAKLGVRARAVPTSMPQNCPDVAGLISGEARFLWAQTRSEILPGAICDNFTSYGGVMTEGGTQTPLTDFLHYGAAGAAGTIIEPYAISEKFASPNIFVHYARGCTLAEAYYQSVFAPAQVLIVGDALCRPWADIPQVEVQGVKPQDKVSGTLVIQPAAKFTRGGEVARFELFVDGRRAGSARAGENLTWDSTTEFDGYHELRVVAIAAGPIETQGRALIPITVNNHGHTATLTATPAETVRWGERLVLDVKAPGMKQIFVLNNGRLLGRIAGEQGQVTVDPRALGLGPVDVQAIGLASVAIDARVAAAPLKLTVEPAQPLPALPAPQNLAPGLLLRLPDSRVVPIQDTRDPSWLSVAGVGPEQPYVFQGYFDVDADEVYQFQIWHSGTLSLTVDGQPVYGARDGDYTLRFAPVALAKGAHRLTVRGRSSTNSKLRILFGGPGSLSINGNTFRHPRRG